jgi:hypothetical protein
MIPVANRKFTIFVAYYAFPASSFHFSLLYLFQQSLSTHILSRHLNHCSYCAMKRPGFDSQQSRDTHFYFSTVSWLVLGPTKSPNQRLVAVSPEGAVYRLDDRDSNPSRCRDFFFRHCVHEGSGARPTSIQRKPRAHSPGAKRQGCEVDHISPPTAEIMNTWSYNSTSPYLMVQRIDKHKDNLILPHILSIVKLNFFQFVTNFLVI